MKIRDYVRIAGSKWATTNLVSYPNVICKWLRIFKKKHFSLNEISKHIPKGWRVPTLLELKMLYELCDYRFDDKTKELVFTDKRGEVLRLPAAGYFSKYDNTLNYTGESGYYWSSTKYGVCGQHFLYFYNTRINSFSAVSKTNCYSIRLIKD